MKLPEVPIEGAVYVLGYDLQQVAKDFGSEFTSPTMYEDYDDACAALRWADDGMDVFKVEVKISAT